MSDKISVCRANEQDFRHIMEGSEGVYEGRDYLPFLFHQWLKTPGKSYMFVGELHGKIVAFQASHVIDGGQTIYCQSLRIHQEYRGRRYSYQMMAEVVNQVHQRFAPGASKVRYTTLGSNQKIKRFSQRLDYECVMEKWVNGFPISKQNLAAIEGFYIEKRELESLKKEDAVEFVLNQRKFDHMIPNKMMVVLKEPFELMPANADRVFKEGDQMFTDLTTDQLRQGLAPRSLSHGRLVTRVKLQSWICNIYANERDLFKAHLIRHLMAAMELLQTTGRKTELEVQNSPDLDFDTGEVFREVIGSQQDFTERLVYYEKRIFKTVSKL